MVYLNIPLELTEEEELLKKKYEQLRCLRNRLNLPKQEPPPPVPIKRTVEDAKEVAKKLLKSGAISAIKIESKDTQGFKRKHNSNKKRNESLNDKQTFSNSDTSNVATTISLPVSKSISNVFSKQSSSVKSLYDNFGSRGKLEDEIKEHRAHHHSKKN